MENSILFEIILFVRYTLLQRVDKANWSYKQCSIWQYCLYLASERPEQAVSVIQFSRSVNTLRKKIALLKLNTQF